MTGHQVILPEQKRKIVGVCSVFVIIGGCVILFLIDPGKSGFLPPCPFYWMTGLWCPGCGSGRALYALLHGNIGRALDLNPLMVPLLPFLAYAGVSQLRLYFREKPLPRVFAGRYWGWFIVCLVIVY